MTITETTRSSTESLLKLADALNAELESNNGRNERSGRGQFATPSEAGRTMAGLLEPAGDALRVVDPGAGAGALMLALVASQAHLVVQNPDEPSRPINSPKWCYQVTSEAVDVIRSFGSAEFQRKLSEYRTRLPGLQEQYRSERDMLKIPVDLPGGVKVELSAGGQNTLLKSMIDEFCSQFTPGGSVLYVGDAGDKWLVFEEEVLESLGVTVDQHGIMPDLVVYMKDRNWIVLLEAVSSHGPVDSNRHIQLKQLFKSCSAGLVFVSCFPDQTTMKKYLTDISWETEVWTADHPTHLVHFDGERFLGPYED